MKFRSFLIALSALSLSLGSITSYADDESLGMYMPDGQITSRVVRVYLYNWDLSYEMNPRLVLGKLGKADSENVSDRLTDNVQYSAIEVIPDQRWTEMREGESFERQSHGTVILFDLSKQSVPFYKPGQRFLPILLWNENVQAGRKVDAKSQIQVISKEDVYLRGRAGILIWTVLVLLIFLGLVYLITMRAERGMLGILCTANGRISVGLTQMALWTLVVGAMVLGFGLMQLTVPEIPLTLIILIGMSYATSAISHYQTYRLQGVMASASQEREPRLSDLVSIPTIITTDKGDAKETEDQSLAKAQLLFWTVITLVIIAMKTIAEGQLWAIPETLVFLMGFSQIGYLARKEMSLWVARKDTIPDTQ